MTLLLTITFFTAAFLLIPDNAYAWGPATHLYFGVELLKDVSVLSPVIASILTKFPYDFLYGCLSADITVGKKYIHYRRHCHNWRTGLKVLAEAESTAQKSFALGYMSHLAADSVAHNFFIPNQLISAFITKSIGHTYWEIRADSLIAGEYWHEVNGISKEIQKNNDRLMRAVVDRTLFPFDVNKQIFNGILMINRLEQWRRIVKAMASRSRWNLGLEEITKYHRLSSLSILDLMISFDQAGCMKLDPTGRRNLKKAKTLRKSLKRLVRRDRLNQTTYESAIRQLPIQAPPYE